MVTSIVLVIRLMGWECYKPRAPFIRFSGTFSGGFSRFFWSSQWNGGLYRIPCNRKRSLVIELSTPASAPILSVPASTPLNALPSLFPFCLVLKKSFLVPQTTASKAMRMGMVTREHSEDNEMIDSCAWCLWRMGSFRCYRCPSMEQWQWPTTKSPRTFRPRISSSSTCTINET